MKKLKVTILSNHLSSSFSMYITFHINAKNDKNYTERTDELNETIEETPAKLTVWRSEEVVGSAESIYKLENNSNYSLMIHNSLYSTSFIYIYIYIYMQLEIIYHSYVLVIYYSYVLDRDSGEWVTMYTR